MIPTECKMPDLSDCSADRLQGRSILHVFVGDPGLNRKEVSYRRIFARLIDKAIYEYQMARRAILAQIAEAKRPYEQMVNEGRRLFILSFVDHFDNCLNASNRALKLFGGMKDEAISSGVPEELRLSLDACSGLLRPVRNTFEHIDERIQKDRIAEGQPIMLSVGGDGDRAVIGTDEVKFTDVAETLRRLHEIGKLLFENEQVKASLASAPVADGGIVLEGKTAIAVSGVGGQDA
jgi:hypothetical protein